MTRATGIASALAVAAIVTVWQPAIGAIRTPRSPEGRQSAARNALAAGNEFSATAAAASPWRVLFDGTSLDAWRGYKSATVPDGWKIVDRTLTKDGHVGDLITKDEFGDFELELEWKIGRAGNSGIFYRGIEDPDFKGRPNDDRIYTTGPEYQLLDDNEAEDNKSRLTCAGANYGLYPSPPGHLKPVGEWNKARIVANGAHVEHWLNDFKVVEYELWSPDWKAKVAATKFNAWPKFGRAKRGHIGVQGDHAGILAFRNIRIRSARRGSS
jgi:3-keto-disaccharide hydrolase